MSERPPHPGHVLLENYLKPLGITPYRLAKGLGVHVSRVTAIIKGERPITTDTAIRLGLFFDVPPKWWLDHQARYDTEGAPEVDALRDQVERFEVVDALVTPKGVHRVKRAANRVATQEARVSDDLMAKWEAQVALEEPAPRRKVKSVTYENGARAVVGAE